VTSRVQTPDFLEEASPAPRQLIGQCCGAPRPCPPSPGTASCRASWPLGSWTRGQLSRRRPAWRRCSCRKLLAPGPATQHIANETRVTTVLYSAVLYCTVMYCTGLNWTGLDCPVLYYTVLYCTVQCCPVLCCTIYTVLYGAVLYCPVLDWTMQFAWRTSTLGASTSSQSASSSNTTGLLPCASTRPLGSGKRAAAPRRSIREHGRTEPVGGGEPLHREEFGRSDGIEDWYLSLSFCDLGTCRSSFPVSDEMRWLRSCAHGSPVLPSLDELRCSGSVPAPLAAWCCGPYRMRKSSRPEV